MWGSVVLSYVSSFEPSPLKEIQAPCHAHTRIEDRPGTPQKKVPNSKSTPKKGGTKKFWELAENFRLEYKTSGPKKKTMHL